MEDVQTMLANNPGGGVYEEQRTPIFGVFAGGQISSQIGRRVRVTWQANKYAAYGHRLVQSLSVRFLYVCW
jgi:hypothetical protein